MAASSASFFFLRISSIDSGPLEGAVFGLTFGGGGGGASSTGGGGGGSSDGGGGGTESGGGGGIADSGGGGGGGGEGGGGASSRPFMVMVVVVGDGQWRLRCDWVGQHEQSRGFFFRRVSEVLMYNFKHTKQRIEMRVFVFVFPW